MSTQSSCPDQETLAALLQGRLTGEELDRIAPHVESCAACGVTLETLNRATGHSPGLDRARTAGPLERAVLPLLSGMLEPCGEPGTMGKLGSWLIHEVIDRGGMGIVLRGTDPLLRREVAIKLLGPELATDAECRARFLREAQAAAAVDHEHVMPVYAVCQDAPLPYLVMPFNQGESLQQRLDREGRLSFAETLRIGRAVAAGLAAAHARGLVHRDVKPGNILLSTDGRVRLADFGLAQAADAVRMTRSGILTGTPGYMAPEQLEGAAPDARTDLFALGAVIYRMLTGRGPFDAPTAMAVMKRVAFDDPPPIKEVVRPPPPPWFITLTEDLLQKKAAARPPGAAAVVDRMDGKSAPDSRSRRRQLIAFALGSAALGIAGWLAQRHFHQPHQPNSNSPIPPSALELDLRLAAERAKTGTPSDRVAWLAAALRKDPAHTGAARMLLHEMAYARVPAAIARGGPAQPMVLTAGSTLLDAQFGSDGQDIYVESAPGVINVWNSRKGQPLLSGFTWPGEARVKASGAELTVFLTPDQELWVVNHRQFSLKTRLPNTLAVSSLCVSEAASVLLTGSTDGRVECWDLGTSRILHSLPGHASGITHLLITTDGKSGVSADADGSLHILDLQKGGLHGAALRHDGPITWAALSPDESLLATGSADGTARVWDLATAAPVTPPLPHSGACAPGGGIIGAFLDNQRLVTAGTDDAMARIWEARTGRPAHEPLPHPGRVTALAAQPGEFATADANGTVRLWDAERAEPASPPLPHSAPVTILQYSPRHTQLLVAGPGGTTWVYALADPKPDLPPWFPELAERLVSRRISPRGVAEPLPVTEDSALRALWPSPLQPGQVGAVRVAEWLLSPADGRALQPFSIPPPPDSPAENTMREMLFRMFREQVEKQMSTEKEKATDAE